MGAELSSNGRTIAGACVWQLAQDHTLVGFSVFALIVSNGIVAGDR